MAAPMDNRNWRPQSSNNQQTDNMSWQSGSCNNFRAFMQTGQQMYPQQRFPRPPIPSMQRPRQPVLGLDVPNPTTGASHFAPPSQHWGLNRPNQFNAGIINRPYLQTQDSKQQFYNQNVYQESNKQLHNQDIYQSNANINFNQSETSLSHSGIPKLEVSLSFNQNNSRSFAKHDWPQHQEDQEWVNNWASKPQARRNNLTEEGTQELKICEVQEKTRRMLVLLAKLQKNQHLLETNLNEDKTAWEQKLNDVKRIQAELDTLQAEITNTESLKALERKVSKRRKKRERMKQRRQEAYETRLLELSQRAEKHALIDKEMQQIVEKQKEAKQEADMQKEGDEILSQVRKKITEANRTVQLLDNVHKLRKLRRDRLERQGVLGMCEPAGSASSLMFEARMDSMKSLLQKQLDTYHAEESALKVILEREQEESREKEREKVKKQLMEKQKAQKRKEDIMLFGKQKIPQMDDPLFPFWQYYHQAENSLESLVSIRHDWDMCLVLPGTPGSSTIPEGWVLPTQPTSDPWASAIQTSSNVT